MREPRDENSDDEFVDALDDKAIDEPEIEEVEELTRGKLQSMRESLKNSEAERVKGLEELQRTRADFLNSKRRLEEQFVRDRERIIDDVIRDLLPLIDSFETAMGDTTNWESLDKTWRTGIEAIHSQLVRFLADYEIEHIEAKGKTFNPHEHEAISNAPQENEKNIDMVVEVLQTGYKRGDTIIRPAKVIVGTGH